MVQRDLGAQGSIEYLVGVAVIVVFSLVIVSFVSLNLDSFTNVSSTSLKISQGSGAINISEVVVDSTGNGLISLSNNSGGLLTITKLGLSGADTNYSNINMPQGDKKTFSLLYTGSGCSCVGFEGKKRVCSVIVYAESEYGLEKQFETNVSVDCVPDASAVTLSSGVQPILSSDEIILAFGFAGLDSGGSSAVNVSAHTVDVSVPFNADVSNLNPVISTVPGVTISPTGSQDFTNPVIYTITTSSGSTQTYTVSVSVLPSSATQLITDFNFGGLGSGVITQGNHTIVVSVPYGTDINNLDPTIGLVSGVTIDPAGPQDFTNPVVYTITASDDLNQVYTVTVNVELNSAKSITAFDFTSPAAVGDINESTHLVAVTVPHGTDASNLTPTILISDEATINPASGVAQDFTDIVTYSVTAQDGSSQDYNVVVTVALNSAKAITGFSFAAPVAVGDINESTHTVSVTVPFGTSVVSLTPTVVITGASVSPNSGVAQNFTNPVTYTVTAANSSTQDYNVIVSVATLQSIAITTPASKLSYAVGEALDITGLVVTGTYSDNSTLIETITTGNVSGFNSSVPATGQVLTITVGSKTTTYTIDIVDSVIPSLSANGNSDSWFNTQRTAVVSASDSGGSGLAEVRYSWGSNSMNGACTSGGTITSNGASLSAASGGTVLYLCARDGSGNTNTWSGNYRWENTLPTCGSWSPASSPWKDSGTQFFTLSGSTDSGGSGINTAGGSCTTGSSNGSTCNVNISDNAGNTRACTSPPNNIGCPASGGTLTRVGNYCVHTFTSSGTFTPPAGGLTCDVLVVGGGGSGGTIVGGGGGAGGFLTNDSYLVSGVTTVTVGNGGIASDGSNSAFGILVAYGGGKGGNDAYIGNNGGSGGGGGFEGDWAVGQGTSGQGNNGGLGIEAGGGGGGANSVGQNSSVYPNTNGGNGGDGKSSSISGSITYYSGGGGGQHGYSGGNNGLGGLGGGGNGESSGSAYTGGGGGGGGGNGGSGIVIVRYIQ